MATPPAPASTGSSRRRPARVSGEEREQAILDVLRRLLGEQPFHAVSVDELASGAGISRPTFYFYFASKEAALLALLEVLVEQAQDAQRDAPDMLEHDREGAWRVALTASYSTWVANREVIAAAAEARSASPGIQRLWAGLVETYVQQTTEAIEAERARGAAADGLPARELAICLNRMSERIYESMLGDDGPTLDDDRVVDVLLHVWLRAIYGTA